MILNISSHLYNVAITCAFMVEFCYGRLGSGFDCSDKKLFFKRRDATSYHCVRAQADGDTVTPVGRGMCADHFVIPKFIGISATDPCICRQTGLLAGGQMICPRRASQGLAIPLEQRYSTTLDAINIPDTGCPGPFQRYINTYRSYSTQNSRIITMRGSPILDPVEECKFRCLLRGSCLGVLYGPIGSLPKCREFNHKGNQHLQNQLSPSLKFTYFGKLRVCSTDFEGSDQVTRPPVQRTTPLIPGANSIITNAKQIGGTVFDRVNITSTQCYNHCTESPSCAAADYNFGTKECWTHSSTHCTSHTKTTDKCCDHFKKGLICSAKSKPYQ